MSVKTTDTNIVGCDSSKLEVEIRFSKPNFLLESWMKEWLDEAIRKDSAAKYSLKEALAALEKFPLPLRSGQDCKILRGFGSTICAAIDKRLENLKNNKKMYERTVAVSSVADISSHISKYVIRKQHQAVDSFLTQPTCSTTNKDECIVMSRGDYRILLLVDTQETKGKSKAYLDTTHLELTTHQIEHEVRRLSVGDFCWIARDKFGNELVMPYIVERKRLDDFACSIRDGRYHEQKHRLRQCGIQNIIYLIEDYGKNPHLALPLSTLLQAATNTQVHSGFQIKFTDSHKHSILYIAVLTKIIKKLFMDKVLLASPKGSSEASSSKDQFQNLMNFKNFNEGSAKNKGLTIREIFIKQLLQLHSVSMDKAIAITNRYPTPRSLIKAYKTHSAADAEKLLQNISYGNCERPVGLQISRNIFKLFCLKTFR